MSGPKIQRQPWIDYLADAMAKEPDEKVNVFAPHIRTIIQTVREDQSKKTDCVNLLKGLKPFIVYTSRNKSRTENLMTGIIQFIEKIV